MTHDDLIRNIEKFIVGMFRRCKDCAYGNQFVCNHDNCPVYGARALARSVEAEMSEHQNQWNTVSGNRVGIGYAVEHEIIDILRRFGEPVPVNQIRLRTTASRVQKCVSITNLVRKGVVTEEKRGDFKLRYISLNSQKENENAGKHDGYGSDANTDAAGTDDR